MSSEKHLVPTILEEGVKKLDLSDGEDFVLTDSEKVPCILCAHCRYPIETPQKKSV